MALGCSQLELTTRRFSPVGLKRPCEPKSI